MANLLPIIQWVVYLQGVYVYSIQQEAYNKGTPSPMSALTLPSIILTFVDPSTGAHSECEVLLPDPK